MWGHRKLERTHRQFGSGAVFLCFGFDVLSMWGPIVLRDSSPLLPIPPYQLSPTQKDHAPKGGVEVPPTSFFLNNLLKMIKLLNSYT